MAVILCDLDMMSYPHTVRRNTSGCVSLTRQGVPGAGAGQHTQTLCEQTLHVSKPERVSNQPQGLWDTGPRHAWAFQDAAK